MKPVKKVVQTIASVAAAVLLMGGVARAEGFLYESETDFYLRRKIDFTNPAQAKKEPRGWYAQAGYFIAGPNIEPAVRYEVYEQDSNLPDKEQKVTTAGLNWYIKGHGLKLMANYVMTKYDRSATGFLAGDDKTNVFQLLGQLYF